MSAYYGVLFLLMIIGIPLIHRWQDRRGKMVFSVFSILLFSFLAGFRYLTGHDYEAYLATYLQNHFFDWNTFCGQRMEKGYVTIGRLLADLSLEPYVLFLAFGFFFAFMVIYFCYRYSNNLWLSLFAFVCFGLFYNSINFMRQFAAMCILMWALRDIKERRPFRFLALVLFASCFHLSAFIFLPFYLLLQIPLNRIVLSIYLLGSAFCFFLSKPLLMFVTKYFYKSYKWKEGSELLMGTRPGVFLGFALLLLVCLIFQKKLLERRPLFHTILINCLFFGTFFEMMGLRHAILSRVSILFMTPAVILLIPEFANLLATYLSNQRPVLTKKTAFLYASLALTIPMILFHAYLLHINYNTVVPYQTLSVYYGPGGAI